MRVLIDTDAFCKLAACGLLVEAVHMLGADVTECGRLPALPYMLRNGRLRKKFGTEICDALIPVAESMPVLIAPNDIWIEKLTPVESIDPGEAQIFSAAADGRLFAVSGDKRALRALKDVAGLAEALSGRIVVLEAILLSLCNHLGPEAVRQRVQVLTALDKVVEVCFSTGIADPRGGLLSYFESLDDDVRPLVLWDPRPEAQHDLGL